MNICCTDVASCGKVSSGRASFSVGTSSLTFMRLRDKALSVTTSDEPDIAIAAISALKIRPIDGYKFPQLLEKLSCYNPCLSTTGSPVLPSRGPTQKNPLCHIKRMTR